MRQKYFLKLIILFVIFIFLLISANSNFDLWTIRRNLEPVQYKTEIYKYAEEFSIDPELLAAVIYVESRFDKYSISSRGAVGLMQLMPSTAVWISEEIGHKNFSLEDLDDPELNIKFGSWYFAHLYHKFDKNLIKTIAAYNAGENNVKKWINDGWDGELEEELPFKETDNFVRRVISTKDYYSKTRNNLLTFLSPNLSE
ncbi:MAG: lytic transglycosylase domain-containing protein [Halanaerobium sp.]